MAGHISCHQSSLQPHSYPPPSLPRRQDHGATSLYNIHHTMNNVHITSDLNKNESFPHVNIPTPTSAPLVSYHHPTAVPMPDPELLITPDKTGNFDSVPQRQIPSKVRRSVHFDEQVQQRTITPEQSNSDLSQETYKQNEVTGTTDQILSRVHRYRVTENDNESEPRTYKYQTFETVPTMKPVNAMEEKPRGLKNNDDTKTVKSKVPETKQKLKSVPVIDHRIKKTYDYPFKNKPPQDASPMVESCLAKPEYHTSLKMGTEIKRLQEAELQVPEAIQQKLKTSEPTRVKLAEKSAERVNVKHPTFVELCPIETPPEQIVERAVKEREQLVLKAQRKSKTRDQAEFQEKPKEPDIMEFYHPGLQKESVDFSTKRMTLSKPKLKKARPGAAFDLYQHKMVWNGKAPNLFKY